MNPFCPIRGHPSAYWTDPYVQSIYLVLSIDFLLQKKKNSWINGRKRHFFPSYKLCGTKDILPLLHELTTNIVPFVLYGFFFLFTFFIISFYFLSISLLHSLCRLYVAVFNTHNQFSTFNLVHLPIVFLVVVVAQSSVCYFFFFYVSHRCFNTSFLVVIFGLIFEGFRLDLI